MSSVKKRPKAPQVIYYQPAPYVDPLPSTPAPAEENKTPETVQQEKESNLLRRARGSISTVLNGFRGLLSTSDVAGQRKSLLGE